MSGVEEERSITTVIISHGYITVVSLSVLVYTVVWVVVLGILP